LSTSTATPRLASLALSLHALFRSTASLSTARLDFSDGSSVRLAPNTTVVLDQLSAADGDRLTKLTFGGGQLWVSLAGGQLQARRSEEHTSELQSPDQLVCRLLLEE